MVQSQEDRLLHSLTLSWIHKRLAVSISSIVLNIFLQHVNRMTEMKQASSHADVRECTQLWDTSPVVVDGALPQATCDQIRLTPEASGRSPVFLRPNVYATQPHSPSPDTVLDSINVDLALTDYAVLQNVRCSPQLARDSHRQQSPLDEDRIRRVCLADSTTSVALSVPVEVRVPKVFQEQLSDNAGGVDLLKDAASLDFGNNFQQTDRNTPDVCFRDNLLDFASIRDEGKSHIYSCPNLLLQKTRLQQEQDTSDIVSPIDWSPLDPNRSAVLEGVDETALCYMRRKPRLNPQSDTYCKRVNTSEPCLPLLEKAGVTNTNVPLPAMTSSRWASVETDTQASLEDHSAKPRSVSEANGELRSTHWKSQVVLVPTEHRSSQPERRGSSSVLLTEDYSRCLVNGTKTEPSEHIEMSSLSPAQRKRKFRRRRSIGLPKRSPTAKKRTGKTKHLCKKRTSAIRAHLVPLFRHSTPTRASDMASSYTSLPRNKKADRQITPGQQVARRRVSNAGIGGLVPPVEYNSNKKTRISVPVSSEPNGKSSVIPSIHEPSSTSHWNRYYDPLAENRKCLRIRRRSSVDKVRGIVVDGGEFTVVPVVTNEAHVLPRSSDSSGRSSLRVPLQSFDLDGEHSDTLTQNSITSLLSAKFRDVAKRWKQYGVDSPRFRKRLHSKWESMNYEEIDSQLQRTYNKENTSKKRLALNRLSSWVIYFFIGISTAFMAAGVQISVEIIAQQKFGLIRDYLDKCSKEDCLFIPVVIWVCINGGITFLAAALVTYVQPMAAGSGIPLIKSYLNGVRVPGLLSLQAFLAKCLGVILSILGGLACGKDIAVNISIFLLIVDFMARLRSVVCHCSLNDRLTYPEGPMAHSGGIVAAGLGKGRIPWLKGDINLYSLFRSDHNIRDLVAAGAASGVSAAFGAPVGGTLFSVEEAASFWNTELVWKVFFSAMIACFSTNVLLSAFEGHPTQLSNPGLVRFNTFPNLTFDLIEVPVFVFMAAIGGLVGALFVVMNYKLTVFRQKYLHRKKWIKVVEAVLVAVVSAIVAFSLMLSVRDCTKATPYSHHAITTTMGCSGDSHNSMSTLFLTTPEGCLKALLHDPLETYSVMTLVLFIVIFFLLGVWTYGLSVSSGVFIPSLAIGAAWGRLVGLGVAYLFPDQAKDVGKYALIGAASQLGGILRTTISLTVIIVECTGDITFGLCIMISLMISKWVGDFFTTGLYDMNIEVSGIPLLSWEPPPLCEHIYVNDFMSQPVMTLLAVEKVGHIYDCLIGETFHGFPVIEQDLSCDVMYKGKLKGIILRHQILVLMKKRVFCPEGQVPTNSVTLADFENSISPSLSLKIQDITLSDAEKEYVMNLSPYMNQTPYTVSLNFSMPRVFRLFRGLGLRHLVVVNDEFEVRNMEKPIGMVTRKDLAKYRAEIKKGLLHMEQLTVEDR